MLHGLTANRFEIPLDSAWLNSLVGNFIWPWIGVALRHLVWIVNLIPISFICSIWNIILMHSFADPPFNTNVLSNFTWKWWTTKFFVTFAFAICCSRSDGNSVSTQSWIIHRKWKVISHSYGRSVVESIRMMNWWI